MQFVSHINLSFINDYCYINEIARPKQIKLIIGSVFHALSRLVARLCVIIDFVFGSAAYNSQNRYGKRPKRSTSAPRLAGPVYDLGLRLSSAKEDPFANIRKKPFSRAVGPNLGAESLALACRASLPAQVKFFIRPPCLSL